MWFQGHVWAAKSETLRFIVVQLSPPVNPVIMDCTEKTQAILSLCPLPEREVQTRTPSPNINSPPRANAEPCTTGTGKTSCLSLQCYYRFKFRFSVLVLVCPFEIAKFWFVFLCVFQLILLQLM